MYPRLLWQDKKSIDHLLRRWFSIPGTCILVVFRTAIGPRGLTWKHLVVGVPMFWMVSNIGELSDIEDNYHKRELSQRIVEACARMMAGPPPDIPGVTPRHPRGVPWELDCTERGLVPYHARADVPLDTTRYFYSAPWVFAVLWLIQVAVGRKRERIKLASPYSRDLGVPWLALVFRKSQLSFWGSVIVLEPVLLVAFGTYLHLTLLRPNVALCVFTNAAFLFWCGVYDYKAERDREYDLADARAELQGYDPRMKREPTRPSAGGFLAFLGGTQAHEAGMMKLRALAEAHRARFLAEYDDIAEGERPALASREPPALESASPAAPVALEIPPSHADAGNGSNGRPRSRW